MPPPTGSSLGYYEDCQGQHSMINSAAQASRGSQQRATAGVERCDAGARGLGETGRTDTSSVMDPTGMIASKLKLKQALAEQNKKNSFTPIPSVRLPTSRINTRRSKSCATNINLLTSREVLSTRRSQKGRFDTRNELFDLTRSTMRSTRRL